MANSLASLVAASSFAQHQLIERTKLFEFDHDAINMANQLSLRDWREWLPVVKAPFENTWLEWSPRDYIKPVPGQRYDPVPREGFHLSTSDVHTIEAMNGTIMSRERANIEDNEPLGAWYVQTGKDTAIIPIFVIFADEPKDDAWSKQSADILWGPAYVAKFGRPSNFTIVNLAVETNKDRFLLEFAGLLRVTLATIALVNMERECQQYPESYRSGRTQGQKGRSVPAYKPHVITLRPDAPRFYSTGNIIRAAASGWHPREHGVRGHWRQLPGRKIWVRDHKRGDASLGVINSSYRVRPAPAVILDTHSNEPPQDNLPETSE